MSSQILTSRGFKTFWYKKKKNDIFSEITNFGQTLVRLHYRCGIFLLYNFFLPLPVKTDITLLQSTLYQNIVSNRFLYLSWTRRTYIGIS